MKNIFCLIKKWWNVTWKKFKVHCIKLELMFARFPLSCFDDKRYILDDGTDTFAYFHKDTRGQ